MTDIVSPAKRSQMMAGIKGKNTKPELVIRSGLHKVGFRFRLHDRKLPGKPDLVFPRFRAVIFVQGCFWHGHDCHLFKWPSSRKDFWQKKISGNQKADARNIEKLLAEGWRVALIWECSIKGKRKRKIADIIETCNNIIETCNNWLRSHKRTILIRDVT
jgi:DNA mismatch endonuclease, patch repair protein